MTNHSNYGITAFPDVRRCDFTGIIFDLGCATPVVNESIVMIPGWITP